MKIGAWRNSTPSASHIKRDGASRRHGAVIDDDCSRKGRARDYRRVEERVDRRVADHACGRHVRSRPACRRLARRRAGNGSAHARMMSDCRRSRRRRVEASPRPTPPSAPFKQRNFRHRAFLAHPALRIWCPGYQQPDLDSKTVDSRSSWAKPPTARGSNEPSARSLVALGIGGIRH
jgi:hypothetical protein